MVTGDATYLKKVNRDRILHTILTNEKISRAEISKLTKLNKATVSSQVAELLEKKLVVESSQDHFKVGRKPIMVSINRKAGYVLGIDVDQDSMITTLADA
ncbi:helix-turn-helix domain-containing protein, partial [Shouchella sp. 1P09AA]